MSQRRQQMVCGVLVSGLLWGGFTLGTVSGQAQEWGIGHWSISTGTGFLVPHRAVIQPLIDGHAQRVACSWTQQAQGIWSAHRHSPRWGVSLQWTATGATEHIGSQITALSHVDLGVYGRLHFRLGGGLGWTQKRWDPTFSQGRERVVIGSAINGAAQIGLGLLPVSSPARWHEHLGLHLRLDHQSNASFTQPNLGTNVVTLGISAQLLRTSPRPIVVDTMSVVLAVLPGPVRGGLLFLGIGRRQPAPLDPRENVVECGYEYRFGGRATFGMVAGAMMMWRPAHFGSSLHGGFQLRFTGVQVDLLHGRYLQRWQAEEGHYNRVVLNVHVSGGWWSRLALHTHGFRAHHPALGIAWLPGNPNPRYPLR